MSHNPKLQPGQQVRVESAARVISQADQNNPYYYTVEFADGKREVVSVARLTPIYDICKVSISDDAVITVASGRLSAVGAIDLYHWLRTHMHEFEEVTQEAPSDSVEQEADER